jgi:hypothetical protein
VGKARELTPQCHERIANLMQLSESLSAIVAAQVSQAPKIGNRLAELRLGDSVQQFGHEIRGGMLKRAGAHGDLSREG